MTKTEALELIASRVRGGLYHPWIPGTEFADGEIFRALRTVDPSFEVPEGESPNAKFWREREEVDNPTVGEV